MEAVLITRKELTMKIHMISSIGTVALMAILHVGPAQAAQDGLKSVAGLVCKTQAALESIIESRAVKDDEVDPDVIADVNKKFGDTCTFIRVVYEKSDKVKEVADGLAVLDLVKLSIIGKCSGGFCIYPGASEDGYAAFAHQAETAT
jgi:hypothetical protein